MTVSLSISSVSDVTGSLKKGTVLLLCSIGVCANILCVIFDLNFQLLYKAGDYSLCLIDDEESGGGRFGEVQWFTQYMKAIIING